MLNVRLILLFLAGALYLLKNGLHYSPLYINVLNDLLAIPVFLVVMEFLMKIVYGKRFKMTWTHIFVTVFTISILFELIFPLMKGNATADPVDVLLYASGGMTYGFFSLPRVNASTGHGSPQN